MTRYPTDLASGPGHPFGHRGDDALGEHRAELVWANAAVQRLADGQRERMVGLRGEGVVHRMPASVPSPRR